MYAVIATGGKQYRAEVGQQFEVELLGTEGDEVSFTPVLIVDGDQVIASGADLAAAAVSAKVIGNKAGPKIQGFTYKNKSNQRRRYGHRQKYNTIEITAITAS